MKKYDSIIVGAGASGMAAALECGKKGQKVLLLDKMDKMGRKILATGNGKCNLTNLKQQQENYRSEHPEIAWSLLSRFGLEETLELFSRIGVYTRDYDGYVYPYSEQAACVREAFEAYILKHPSIVFRAETEVQGIKSLKEGYLVRTAGEEYMCRSLIIASGGFAGPKFGCSGSGYGFAKKMGHNIVSPFPALTALKSSAPFLKKVSGVRNKAEITLHIEGQPERRERGELQWTDYGISGVAVFQLSRFAVIALEENKKVCMSINFMPELSEEEIRTLLFSMRKKEERKSALLFANGLFPAKLSPVILREAGILPEQEIRTVNKEKMERLIQTVRHFVLRINGYKGYDKAQVTRGGIACDELTLDMESRLCPGLYFCGEVVDVDGMCGGYNLQWAFASGSIAGRAACCQNQKKHR